MTTTMSNVIKPRKLATANAQTKAGRPQGPPLHRIGAVRRQQGVSLRSAARQMGSTASTLKAQEAADADISLSELYAWQQVLEVPVADLLVESSAPLSRPVMERARMVRLMKTAAALVDKAESDSARRMAQMLVDQLIEVMPELAEVSAWHSVGQRRGLDEFGQVFENRVSDEWWVHAHNE